MAAGITAGFGELCMGTDAQSAVVHEGLPGHGFKIGRMLSAFPHESDKVIRSYPGRLSEKVEKITGKNLIGLLQGSHETGLPAIVRSFLLPTDDRTLKAVNKDCATVHIIACLIEAVGGKGLRVDCIMSDRQTLRLGEPEWEFVCKYFPEAISVTWDHRVQLTDGVIRAFAKHCPRVSYFNFSRMKQITDAGVMALAKHFPKMTSLNLFASGRITNDTVISLAEWHPQLKEIFLGCHRITDAAVIALAKRCRALTRIDLRACPITDVAVMALALYCRQLERVDLYNCKHITDAAVIALHEGCRAWQWLDLRGCEALVTFAQTLNIRKI